MKIARLEALLVDLRMKKPFRVSFGQLRARPTVIVRLTMDDGRVGYGEAAPLPEPSYCAETPDTCMHVLERYLGPSVVGRDVAEPRDAVRLMSWVRGHHFAKTAVECALWHIHAAARDRSLSACFGGTRTSIPVGESLGIHDQLESLLEEVELRLSQGFRRIKLKVAPGWDVQVVRAVRRRFGEIALTVDANSAYDLESGEVFVQLDDAGLQMIEQPLADDDLSDHAILQAKLRTPICLDESVHSVADAKAALALGSCRVMNIKTGRVGGPLAAMEIHDRCRDAGVPVWMGGMFESGIGRAFNLALASLPNFSLPADMSPAEFYFDGDLVDPSFRVEADGTIRVPQAPGLGFPVDEERIRRQTQSKVDVTADMAARIDLS